MVRNTLRAWTVLSVALVSAVGCKSSTPFTSKPNGSGMPPAVMNTNAQNPSMARVAPAPTTSWNPQRPTLPPPPVMPQSPMIPVNGQVPANSPAPNNGAMTPPTPSQSNLQPVGYNTGSTGAMNMPAPVPAPPINAAPPAINAVNNTPYSSSAVPTSGQRLPEIVTRSSIPAPAPVAVPEAATPPMPQAVPPVMDMPPPAPPKPAMPAPPAPLTIPAPVSMPNAQQIPPLPSSPPPPTLLPTRSRQD